MENRDTRILSDAEVKEMTKALNAALGPAFVGISTALGVSAEDSIRFHAVAAMFAGSRESRGLSVKEVAALLRVPQYRLKAIEKSQMSEVRADVLARYAAFLKLEDWLTRWKGAHPKLAAKLDKAVPAPVPPRRTPVAAHERRAAKPAAPIYRLKVTLRRCTPPIWRRFLVPSDITLKRLHDTLQGVMGWTDSHLHQFTARGVRYGTSDEDLEYECVSEAKTKLNQVLRRPKDRLLYEYDFGDSWEHDVVLEAIVPPVPGARYPIIEAGQRACPPEDVGGTSGYASFLSILANPRHPEHRETLEWVGGRFDPDEFP